MAPPKESFSLIPLLTLASGTHGPAAVPTVLLTLAFVLVAAKLAGEGRA